MYSFAMFGYTKASVLILCWTVGVITSLSQTNFQETRNVTIDLSSYDKLNKTSQTVLHYLHLSAGECNANNIEVINAPGDDGFFIIQLHSFQTKFNLRNDQNEQVTGTNTGLVQMNLEKGIKYRYYMSCAQESNRDVKILLAVVVYEKEDPVPGGCNLTLEPKISAYQVLSYTESMVKLDAQPASVFNFTCERTPVLLEMYHLYLREQVLDEDDYFSGLSKMLTSDGIIDNGRKVPKPDGLSCLRRYYSAYLGTGTVYGVVAMYHNRTSAYIPTVSYACDTNNWDDNCELPASVLWKVLCAFLLFFGIFSLYLGHSFYKAQMFLVGLIFGALIAYIISFISDNFTVGQNLAISIIVGCVYGVAWIAFWRRYGLPSISVALFVLFIGYIMCCITFYSYASDTEFARRNLNYWAMFLSISVPFAILLVTRRKFAFILTCTFLGATAITISVNHYAGGNLHYIFLNNVRRATVPNFDKAIIDPVFQYADILLSVMWIALIGSGISVQLKLNRGRAPFPRGPVTGVTDDSPSFWDRVLALRQTYWHTNERSYLLNREEQHRFYS